MAGISDYIGSLGGGERLEDEQGRIFLNCFNDAVSDIADGVVVVIRPTFDTTGPGTIYPIINATAPATDAVGVTLLGVVATGGSPGFGSGTIAGETYAGIKAGTSGQVQIRGYCAKVNVDASGAAIVIGDSLKAVNAASALVHDGTLNATMSTWFSAKSCGVAQTALASGTGSIAVNLLGYRVTI